MSNTLVQMLGKRPREDEQGTPGTGKTARQRVSGLRKAGKGKQTTLLTPKKRLGLSKTPPSRSKKGTKGAGNKTQSTLDGTPSKRAGVERQGTTENGSRESKVSPAQTPPSAAAGRGKRGAGADMVDTSEQEASPTIKTETLELKRAKRSAKAKRRVVIKETGEEETEGVEEKNELQGTGMMHRVLTVVGVRTNGVYRTQGVERHALASPLKSASSPRKQRTQGRQARRCVLWWCTCDGYASTRRGKQVCVHCNHPEAGHEYLSAEECAAWKEEQRAAAPQCRVFGCVCTGLNTRVEGGGGGAGAGDNKETGEWVHDDATCDECGHVAMEHRNATQADLALAEELRVGESHGCSMLGCVCGSFERPDANSHRQRECAGCHHALQRHRPPSELELAVLNEVRASETMACGAHCSGFVLQEHNGWWEGLQAMGGDVQAAGQLLDSLVCAHCGETRSAHGAQGMELEALEQRQGMCAMGVGMLAEYALASMARRTLIGHALQPGRSCHGDHPGKHLTGCQTATGMRIVSGIAANTGETRSWQMCAGVHASGGFGMAAMYCEAAAVVWTTGVLGVRSQDAAEAVEVGRLQNMLRERASSMQVVLGLNRNESERDDATSGAQWWANLSSSSSGSSSGSTTTAMTAIRLRLSSPGDRIVCGCATEAGFVFVLAGGLVCVVEQERITGGWKVCGKHTVPEGMQVQSVTWMATMELVVLGTYCGRVLMLPVGNASGKHKGVVRELVHFDAGVESLCARGAGDTLVCALHNASVHVVRVVHVKSRATWKVAGKPVRLDGGYGAVTCCAMSRDGKWVAAGGENDGFLLYGVDDGRLVDAGGTHEGFVTGLAFDETHERVWSVGRDGMARAWPLPAQSGSLGEADVLFEYRLGKPITNVVSLHADLLLLGSASTLHVLWCNGEPQEVLDD